MFKLGKLAIIGVVLSILLLIVTSCGGNITQNEPESSGQAGVSQGSGEKSGPWNITILGGSVGGVWSAITEGVAESVRRNAPSGSNITSEVGKDGPNNVMVANMEAELAISYSPTAYAALEGIDPYKDAYPGVRAVAVLNPGSTFHFLVLENTGLTSIEDIKAKKFPLSISVNAQGSTMELASKTLLNAYGISYQDIESWGGKVFFLSTSQTMEAIDDGLVQAHSLNGEHPISHFVEASIRRDFNLLPISSEAINKVNQALGTRAGVIPGGTYSFTPEEIPTFAASLLLVTGADQSEDFIYSITKNLNDNLDYLSSVHAILKDINLIEMADTSPIPLHPGAEKFYKEMGVLK